MLAPAALVTAIVGLSLVHPWGDLRGVDSSGEILGGAVIPANVRSMIETKCADCHSHRTHWPVYSRLAPASWLIERDVHVARGAMNLSEWNRIPREQRIAALTRIAAEVSNGQMPPRPYAFMHPAYRLTIFDKRAIANWARAERKRLRTLTEEEETKHE